MCGSCLPLCPPVPEELAASRPSRAWWGRMNCCSSSSSFLGCSMDTAVAGKAVAICSMLTVKVCWVPPRKNDKI